MDTGGKIPQIRERRKDFLFFFLFLFYLIINEWFFFILVCTCPLFACLVTTEVRRGHQIPGNWSCGWLRTTMWVLGIQPRASARAASAPNPQAISSACVSTFLNTSQLGWRPTRSFRMNPHSNHVRWHSQWSKHK